LFERLDDGALGEVFLLVEVIILEDWSAIALVDIVGE